MAHKSNETETTTFLANASKNVELHLKMSVCGPTK